MDVKCNSLNEWITNNTSILTIVLPEHQINTRRRPWSPECPMWILYIPRWKGIKMEEGGYEEATQNQRLGMGDGEAGKRFPE